jgi:Tol biopolymer transport system component
LLLLQIIVIVMIITGAAKTASAQAQTPVHSNDSLIFSGEKHLHNVRQITSQGINAEAYLSPDDTRLVFQSTRDTFHCDQIYTMNLDGSNVRLVSTGGGRTTCSYFLPDGAHVLYASTHLGGAACPPTPDRKKGYVWGLYPTYDIFVADTNGTITKRLTDTPGYDAEAVVSPAGDRIAFTSIRSGDLDIYSMKMDGSDIKQLTNELGYDGGPFYSSDGKRIVYRAYHPSSEAEKTEYKALLAEEKIRPINLQICMMDADGSNKVQLTTNRGTNFAPFMLPDGKRVIFSSNMADTSASALNFDLYLVNTDGSGLERVTWCGGFNSFPMFTKDGKTLVFESTRKGKSRYDINVFVAEWTN